DVKAVMRNRAGSRRRGDGVRRPADPSSEAIGDVLRELPAPDVVEELVPDPIGLDDARIEWVDDAVGAGDQREVGPGAVERAGQLCEPGIRGACSSVLEERARRIGSTEAERVRRVRIPGEQERAGGGRHRAGTGARRRKASAAATAAPAVTRAMPAALTAAPSTAPESVAVTTAPRTRTAVTSTACARASAAYQVATYAVSRRPVSTTQRHCSAESDASCPKRPPTATQASRIPVPSAMRQAANTCGGSSRRRCLTYTTSTAHRSVAARIIASPDPNAIVPAWPTSQA